MSHFACRIVSMALFLFPAGVLFSGEKEPETSAKTVTLQGCPVVLRTVKEDAVEVQALFTPIGEAEPYQVLMDEAGRNFAEAFLKRAQENREKDGKAKGEFYAITGCLEQKKTSTGISYFELKIQAFSVVDSPKNGDVPPGKTNNTKPAGDDKKQGTKAGKKENQNPPKKEKDKVIHLCGYVSEISESEEKGKRVYEQAFFQIFGAAHGRYKLVMDKKGMELVRVADKNKKEDEGVYVVDGTFREETDANGDPLLWLKVKSFRKANDQDLAETVSP